MDHHQERGSICYFELYELIRGAIEWNAEIKEDRFPFSDLIYRKGELKWKPKLLDTAGRIFKKMFGHCRESLNLVYKLRCVCSKEKIRVCDFVIHEARGRSNQCHKYADVESLRFSFESPRRRQLCWITILERYLTLNRCYSICCSTPLFYRFVLIKLC